MIPLVLTLAAVAAPQPPANPAIDPDGHLRAVRAAHRHRQSRRLPEDDFLRLSREPGAVVLDARSGQKYDLLHVRGAINLSFSDIDVASLARVLPDKSARVLIYCNNNFHNAELAMPSKLPTLSLNLSTYTALYESGYRNVYELAPILDPATTKLPLAGTTATTPTGGPGR